MTDVEAARWLAELSARGVHQHWQQRLTSPLPDRSAALRGLGELLQTGERNRALLRRIVVGAWALCAPRPTEVIPADAWLWLFRAIGPSVDERSWQPPESLTIYRAALDHESMRSGFCWTTERAVARCHRELITNERMRLCRIFVTEAPRAALLASITTNGEAEVVVDAENLGEVSDVSPAVWHEWPEPIRVLLPDGMQADVPDVSLWNRYPRATRMD